MAHGVQGQAHAGEFDAVTAREVAETMHALATPSRVRILAITWCARRVDSGGRTTVASRLACVKAVVHDRYQVESRRDE